MTIYIHAKQSKTKQKQTNKK